MNWEQIYIAASTTLEVILCIAAFIGICLAGAKFDKINGEGASCGCIVVIVLISIVLFGVIGTPLSYYMKQPPAPPPVVEVEKR